MMQKLTNKVVFDRLVALYGEIATLELDVAAVVDEAKDVLGDSIDLPQVKKIAKLVATEKLGSTVEKTNAFLAAVEELA